MELGPGPVQGRRIQGRDVVEKGRWSHMKWGVAVADFPGLGHGQESQTD